MYLVHLLDDAFPFSARSIAL